MSKKRVKFTLTMENLTVDGIEYRSVTIEWEAEADQEEVISATQKWISPITF